MSQAFMEENPLITKAAGFDDTTDHFFIKDKDMNKTLMVLKTGREYVVDMKYYYFNRQIIEFTELNIKDKLLIKMS